MKRQMYIKTLILLFFPVWLQAQTYQVSGKVIDEKNQPVEVVNVILLNPADSSYVDGAITESDGSFLLHSVAGNQLLYLKLIGYEESYQPVRISGATDLGKLTLQSNTIGLEAVTVTAAKPIIKREIDRIVFDVSNSPLATGGTALDILHDVPGLLVDNGSISIIGKGDIRVYINDKELKLSGEELTSYLRTYSSSDIENVEVYTIPPSRFEAAGNAGIINIKLKRKRRDYIGGDINTGYGYSEKESFGNSALNLTFNKNRVSSFVSVASVYGGFGSIERSQTYYPGTVWKSYTDSETKLPIITADGGLDIQLDNDWNVGIQGRYSKRPNVRADYAGRTDIYPLHSQVADSFFIGNEHYKGINQHGLFNIHVDKTFDESGKKMLWDMDYFSQKIESDRGNISEGFYANGDELEDSALAYLRNENTQSAVYSSSLDFILPFTDFRMTVGAKFSHARSDKGLLYEHSTIDIDQRDQFDYKENIYAVYADAEKAFSEKFTAKAGLRIEHTMTDTYSYSYDSKNKRNYTRLFPTVYLLYKPTDKHDLYIRFSDRISRPSSNMLNPFISYDSKYSSSQGKTDLRPYYIYNGEIGYTWDGNLDFNVYYSQHTNGISQLSDKNPETSYSFTQWDNFLSERSFGGSNSYTVRLSWLQTFIQHGVSYINSRSDSDLTYPEINSWHYYASIRNTLYFNKSKTFTGSINGSYGSKRKLANTTYNQSYDLSVGVRYAMLNNKLNMSITGSNIVCSHNKGVSNSNGILTYFDNSFRFPTLRVGISYTFGAELRQSRRNYSSADAQGRL